jgi:DNA-binding XRE family transcriptional regulator
MSRETLELSRMRGLVAGGLVREIRVGAGLTLAEIAKDVGVHPSTVFYWETGRSVPRGEGAVRYARLILELESMARR